jgi:hypothetical protein
MMSEIPAAGKGKVTRADGNGMRSNALISLWSLSMWNGRIKAPSVVGQNNPLLIHPLNRCESLSLNILCYSAGIQELQ